jgi:hypothetical protein
VGDVKPGARREAMWAAQNPVGGAKPGARRPHRSCRAASRYIVDSFGDIAAAGDER